MSLLPRKLREAMLVPATTEDTLLLVEIDKDGWSTPVRLADRALETFSVEPLRQGVRSGGVEYDFAIVSSVHPDDIDGALPVLPLVFENVEGDLNFMVDEEGLTARVREALATDPDEIVTDLAGLTVRTATATEETVTVELGFERVELEPTPWLRFTPQTTPGLFR
jgi:hypothetical protein